MITSSRIFNPLFSFYHADQRACQQLQCLLVGTDPFDMAELGPAQMAEVKTALRDLLGL